MAELQRSLNFRGRGLEVKDITFIRHKGNSRSIEANKRCAPFKESTRNRIVDLVKACGLKGMTSAELEIALNKAKNKFSGRLTALEAAQILAVRGDREGCGVYVYIGSESTPVEEGREAPEPGTGSPVPEGHLEPGGGAL